MQVINDLSWCLEMIAYSFQNSFGTLGYILETREQGWILKLKIVGQIIRESEKINTIEFSRSLDPFQFEISYLRA